MSGYNAGGARGAASGFPHHRGGGGRGRGYQQNQQQQQQSPPQIIAQPATGAWRGGRGGAAPFPQQQQQNAWGNRGGGGGGGVSPQQHRGCGRGAGASNEAPLASKTTDNNNTADIQQQQQAQQPQRQINIAVWIGRPLPLSAVSAELMRGIDLRHFQDPTFAWTFISERLSARNNKDIFAVVIESKEAMVFLCGPEAADKREQLVAGGIALCTLISPYSASDVDQQLLAACRTAAMGGAAGQFLDCRSFSSATYFSQMFGSLQKILSRARAGESMIEIPAGLPRTSIFLGTSPLGRVFGYTDCRTRQRYVARATDRIKPEDIEQYTRRARINFPHIIPTLPLDRNRISTPPVLVRSVKYLSHFELQKSPQPVVLLLKTASVTLQCMREAHAGGLLFRCLSPLIIVFTMEQNPKIALDTSFCVLRERPTMWADLLLPRYAAPEGMIYATQRGWAERDKVVNTFSEASDVWSFGLCLIRLATGKQPFEALSRTGEPDAEQLILYLRGCVERNESAPTMAIPDMPNLPKELTRLIFACLSLNPEKRPTVQQLLDDPLFAAASNSSSVSAADHERSKMENAVYFRKPLQDGKDKAELSSALMRLQKKTRSGAQGFSLADAWEVSNHFLSNRFETKFKAEQRAAAAAAVSAAQQQSPSTSSSHLSPVAATPEKQRHADPEASLLSPASQAAASEQAEEDVPEAAAVCASSPGSSSRDDTNRSNTMMAQTSSSNSHIMSQSINFMAAAAAASAGAAASGVGGGGTAHSLFLFVATADDVAAEPLMRWGCLPAGDPLTITALSNSNNNNIINSNSNSKKKAAAPITMYRFPLAAARAAQHQRRGDAATAGLSEGELLHNIIMFEVLTCSFNARQVDLGDADVVFSHQSDDSVDLLLDAERVVLLKPGILMRPKYVMTLKVEKSVVSALLRTGAAARRYVMLDRKLGAGACGVVHAGLELPSQRPVAVKVLKLQSEAAAREIAVELRAMLAMKQHGNIAQVLHCEVSRSGDLALIVMELMSCTLADLVAAAPQLAETDLLRILFETSSGLSSLAHMGLIHTDVKLANIGISLDGSCKLLDFGMAVGTSLGDGNKIRGFTPAYVAPEVWRQQTQQQQLQQPQPPLSASSPPRRDSVAAAAVSATADDVVSSASDIYSLGVTLWLAAKGWTRFPQGALDYSSSDWLDVRQRMLREQMPQQISVDLQKVLLQMTDAKAEARPSADELSKLDLYFTHAASVDKQQQQHLTSSQSSNSFNSSMLMSGTGQFSNSQSMVLQRTAHAGSAKSAAAAATTPATVTANTGDASLFAASVMGNDASVAVEFGNFSMPTTLLEELRNQ